MKKILMLGTGGTIASVPSENGLVPALDGKTMVALVPELFRFKVFHFSFEAFDEFCMQSGGVAFVRIDANLKIFDAFFQYSTNAINDFVERTRPRTAARLIGAHYSGSAFFTSGFISVEF